MLEPRDSGRAYLTHLSERRSQLVERLAERVPPVEAIHILRTLLDDLQAMSLSERTPHERQVGERAVRIVAESTELLRAVRGDAWWPTAAGRVSSQPTVTWRFVGLGAVQVALTLGLLAVLIGAFQQPTTGGGANLLLGLLLALGLISVQGVTVMRLAGLARQRGHMLEQQPEIALSVDSEKVMSTLGQALLAVEQLERVAAPRTESASQRSATLAEFPELLRAVQHVYAAHLAGEPQRALQRAEGLRASLETYGVTVHDAWPGREAPPPDLFAVQRSADQAAIAYRVILPALTDASGVLMPGRLAAPYEETSRTGAQLDRRTVSEERP